MSLPLSTMLDAFRQRAQRGELQPFHVLPAVWASQSSVEGRVDQFLLGAQEAVKVRWSVVPESQRWDLAFADPDHAGWTMQEWVIGQLNLFWLS